MASRVRFRAVLFCVVAVAGCRSAPLDYDAPLPPGRPALQKITSPGRLPDFTRACARREGLAEAVRNSLEYLAKPSSRAHFPCGPVTHARAVASLRVFARLLDANLPPAQMNAVIRAKFDVYRSVGCDGRGTVLFTGYYTPVFEASRTRTARFRHPLYAPPKGLVKRPDGSPLRPLPDRRTIESCGLYAGNELVWLADPFEAYLCHVQGSARLRLRDGRLLTVGYAAHNGHDYRSVRRAMVKAGKIGPRAGLPSMRRYFRTHPDEVRKWTWENPRFIFFTVVRDGRPRGCLNQPVIPFRSIATDKSIFPRACLAFVDTRLPADVGGRIEAVPFQGFVLDQDAGGAIRAPGRCDVYMGEGERAGQLAGRTAHVGHLYYLFLKEDRAAGVTSPVSSAGAASPPAVVPPARAPAARPGRR